ncbi:MAG: sugar phosphate isomerase/epimerase family protein [Bryobacteraceae bacterium]
MKRREFLENCARAALAAGVSKIALPQTSDTPKAPLPHDPERRSRICISTCSFHNLFPQTRDEKAPPLTGKPLDVLDFPDMIADHYSIHNLEVVAPHFASTESSYLRDFKSRLERAHSQLVNIPVDIDELWNQPALSGTEQQRDRAISLYNPWIDIAHDLGARSVRCDPGKVNAADPSPTIDSYKALVSRGRSKDIRIIVENHGGVVSGRPEMLVKILETSGAGALPDFGNWPNEETRERGLRLMFPLATTVCHAKLKQGGLDFARCMQISKEAHFQGVYSIEAGGKGDPYNEVQQVVD